mgnify:CR=1 FL=1
MKIDDYLLRYKEYSGYGRGYAPGEFPEFSRERAKQMLKDLLKLASNKAKIKKVGNSGSYLDASVDKESILSVLEDEN